MARPLRIEFPGAIYHITSRGNAKEDVFVDEGDRIIFLQQLTEVKEKYNWRLYAFCLMTNHYHLVVETPDGNLSIGMRHLNGVYTQKFNYKHERVGHIFQGRFKAILVQKESYLLEVCRYVVLNPVRAGLVSQPEDWKWSSYCETAGTVNRAIPLYCTDWILTQFGNNKDRSTIAYKEFILAGISQESPWKDLKGRTILGKGDFVENIKKFSVEKETIKEIPRLERFAGRPELIEIFGGKSEKSQNELIWTAHIRYGYKLKEIGDFLGIHYSTVSRAVRKERNAKIKT